MDLVSKIQNRIFSSNTYFFTIPGSKNCFIIDPGLDFEAIVQHLASNQLRPVAILCTHGHFDHLGSAQLIKEQYDCPLYLHQADIKISKSANFLLMACKIDHRISTPTVDVLVTDDCQLQIRSQNIQWIHVPGHTPGSCFISINQSVFTGDTLYKKAIGLSDFPGENKSLLIQSLLKIWDLIDKNMWVYPGHGGADQFGKIKENNRPLRKLLNLGSHDQLNAIEATI